MNEVDTPTARAQHPINKLADTSTPKLKEFGEAPDSVAQNKLLFDWLSDDLKRKDLYDELRREGFPALHFKSLLTSKKESAWQKEDVYLLSRPDQVEAALKHYSVEPYQALDSGGEFMLGLDDCTDHNRQRGVAERAIGVTSEKTGECERHVTSEEIEGCAHHLHEQGDRSLRARSLSASCHPAAEEPRVRFGGLGGAGRVALHQAAVRLSR